MRVVALQSDGKIIAGGSFSTYGVDSAQGLVRINPDGTFDTQFAFTGGEVYGVAIQADGKVLACGDFTGPRPYLARVDLASGTMDAGFAPVIDGPVYGVAARLDGTILINGGFTTVGGGTHWGYARLLATGVVDPAVVGSVDGKVNWITELTDGRLVIAGDFTQHESAPCNRGILRLSAGGLRDPAFGSITGGVTGGSPEVFTMLVQPGARIIIGGPFAGYTPVVAFPFLARLNADGTFDYSFAGGGTGPDNNVLAIARQEDGKVLVGGPFTLYGSAPCNGLARLTGDGMLDTTFDTSGGVGPLPGTNAVCALAIQPDGRILIAGDFTQYNGDPLAGIARIWD